MKTQQDLQDTNSLDKIVLFLKQAKGLKLKEQNNDFILIEQSIDGKEIKIDENQINQVIPRWDSNGKNFLQVNFAETKKVILTETLVGFKPYQSLGIDMSKLPNVVTTPDLLSVLEAIEESLLEGTTSNELEVLKSVFNSVLKGAEQVGFNLDNEKVWLSKISRNQTRASA